MTGKRWLFLMLAGIFLFAAGIGSGVAGTLLVQNGSQPAQAQPQPTPSRTGAPVTATLIHKSFIPADANVQEYFSNISFTLQLTNTSTKDIRAFTGLATFKDLFDKEILTTPVTYESGLKAGESVKWDWRLQYRLIASHLRLKEIAEADLKSDVRVDEVIFTDGTRVKYP